MSVARLAAGLCLASVAAVGLPGDAGAAAIVGEYTPGVTAAALGGRLTVNGYGVAGIGVHRFALDDGSAALGLCIQANVSHSTSADYQLSANAVNNGALDYLTWRYLDGAGPSDVAAAGMAVAVWGLIGSQRPDGGVIVTPGTIVVEVAGAGRRTDIESAAARFVDEALRRRGPWTMSDLVVVDGAASVRLDGPAGAISGRPVTFELSAAAGGAAWQATADTDDGGVATVDVSAAGSIDGRTLTASAVGPGRSIELSAPGAQRFALAGTPAALSATHVFPAAPPATTTSTTTTTTTTTRPSTSTATAPTTTAPATTAPATSTTPTTASTVVRTTMTTSTMTATSTSTAPSPTTVPDTSPPTLPATSTSTSAPIAEPTTPSTSAPTSAPTTVVTTTSEPVEPSAPPSSDGPPGSVGSVPPDEPSPQPPPGIAVTGGAARPVIRAGAVLFAIGSVVSLVSAGRRRRQPHEERSG
ncbi:hypothetical protein [Desertimonas flava]|uniref:hypothetical protein n=1 Tax=Desertimonas flava TaxID=2064846 RepID=UPI0013C4B085|nr:hypothetical protein [Desertimonas flava]